MRKHKKASLLNKREFDNELFRDMAQDLNIVVCTTTGLV